VRLAEIVEHLSIPTPKVTGYLLNVNHKDGGPKAAFFMRFGFDPERAVELMDALLEHGDMNEITTTETDSEATVYTVEGAIVSPDGRNPRVRTVWQVDVGSSIARFITAVPRSRRRGNR